MAETPSFTSSASQTPPASQETRSTCCYCGVGCGVIIEHSGGQITGVRGDPDHPANFGRLCTKGSTLHLTMQPDSLAVRALYPELRTSRDGQRTRTDWNTALDHAQGPDRHQQRRHQLAPVHEQCGSRLQADAGC
jgi:anaerobic selenocysteine-containing dehydrogenase